MKTHHSNLFIWALTFVLSGSSLVACAQVTTGTKSTTVTVNPAKSLLLTPLQQSITKLKKLASTGDPDFDYAFQAKAHAEGTRDFLKQEIQNGKDSTLLALAKTLLADTQTEITLLDGTMRQLKPTRPSQAFAQQQSRNIEAINLKLQQTGSSDKLTNDLDKNFSTLLGEQRQDAIDLATTFLQYGKNTTLRTYAQQLINKSKKQIDTLKGQQPKQN